jgi:PTS system glucitol/sorbitol-specific IIA component
MTQTIYDTHVTAIGDLVPQFREQGMLVFFGANAPEELHDFCILHVVNSQADALVAGDVITIGDKSLTVLAVGDVASQNLMNLGHLNLKANGLTAAELPGDVNVEVQELPDVEVGTRIVITRSA